MIDAAMSEVLREFVRTEIRAAIREELPAVLGGARQLTGPVAASEVTVAEERQTGQAQSTARSASQQPATPLDNGLWNAHQTAAFLGMSPSWVYHQAAAGRIPCIRVVGALRFDPEALRAWARGERQGGRVVAMRR